MALLSRMVGAPLTIDIGPGAVAGLAPLLADRRISSGGHVAIAVGPGQGEEIAEVLRPQLANADIWMVEGGSVEAATELRGRLRSGFFDAVVGIGGGKTLDTAKHAAALSGLPMVAVATSLAHDGIASPVSSLEDGGRKASFGVQMPIAVVVDLDYVRASDASMRRSGIGDVVSNLGAIADWWLAARERGEPVDGLAVTFARTAATAILHREDGIDDDDFLIALAEALVLSGLAMATAGSSRPCSGGDHEILHAIDHLYPGTAHHGELAGVGSLFTSWLRGDAKMARDIDACLTRHGLPRTPPTSGSTPSSSRARWSRRPARGPIATRSSSTSTSPRRRWSAASARSQRPTIAELRAVAQPARIFERNSGEHWAGKLYVRRYSIYLTRLVLPTRVTPNALTWGMIVVGVLAAAALTRARAVGRGRRGAADPGARSCSTAPTASSRAGAGSPRRSGSTSTASRTTSPSRCCRSRWGSAPTAAGTRSAPTRRSASWRRCWRCWCGPSRRWWRSRAWSRASGAAEDTAAVAAPRASGLARVRRALGFFPFFRAFVAIEATLLALAAAIADAFVDGMPFTRGLVIALVPIAAITAAGHLLAILNSSRLR